ncbi:MAG: hypothetical protein VXW65_15355 [Pseudomonadota bacterium]|nr:hypothetical protein [Pseudomonadota bacterium]
MSAPIFLWDPVLSEALPNSVEQADEYRIQLRKVGHDHSPRVDHFAELLKAKVAAEKTFDADFKQKGYLESAYLFKPQHTAALVSWDYFKDAYADLFFVLMVEAAREAGLLIYDTRSEWVFLPDGNMLPRQAASSWDKHAKAVKAKSKKGFNVATDMPSTDAQCEKLMRSVMLEPLTALGFTEQVCKDDYLRDREYKAFILEINGFRLQYQLSSFMKKVLDQDHLKLLPHYGGSIGLTHQELHFFKEERENEFVEVYPKFIFDFRRQFCKVCPAGNIPLKQLYFRTRSEIDSYLQRLIQALQQLVSQCTSLSQLHHYIHYDKNNLFKTQIMYQDYCTSFVYHLARRCEDDVGFANLIEHMRSVCLKIWANIDGEHSEGYAMVVANYARDLAAFEAEHLLYLDQSVLRE